MCFSIHYKTNLGNQFRHRIPAQYISYLREDVTDSSIPRGFESFKSFQGYSVENRNLTLNSTFSYVEMVVWQQTVSQVLSCTQLLVF